MFKRGESLVRVVDSLVDSFSEGSVSSLFSETGIEASFSSVQERCLKSCRVVGRRSEVSLDCD